MPTRRAFLGAMALPAAAGVMAGPSGVLRLGRSAANGASLAATPGRPEAIACDEDFWSVVSRAFTIDRSLVNLNNGGVSPSPAIVQEAMKRHLDYSNSAPPSVTLHVVTRAIRESFHG